MDWARLSLPEKKRELLFWFILLGVFLYAQFGHVGLLQRSFIDHDDLLYIAPLEKLSLGEYLRHWFPDRSHYAFPLQDLSFRIDFTLGHALGVKTFWLTNLLLFLATVFSLDRISRLYFRDGSFVRLGMLAAFVLHPVLTEPLQWAYLRKSLLVSSLIMAGTFVVLRSSKEERAPSRREWAAIWGCYVASLLCFPSAQLWIYWSLWTLRKRIAEKRTFLLMLAGAAALHLLYLYLILSGGTGWAEALHGSFNFRYLLLGIGRGVWNLLFPFWLAPYYSIESPFNIAGLALGAALVLLGWRRRQQLVGVCILLSLAVAIFLPQLFIVLTYSDFVWSDRYLFLPLPYLALALSLVFSRVSQRTQYFFAPFAALFLAAYVPSILLYAPSWTGDIALMAQCALTEAAQKCLIRSVESTYMSGGCGLAAPWISLAREKIAGRDIRRYPELKDNLPFYLYLCTTEDPELTGEEKWKKLESLPPELRVGALRAFSRILLQLHEGEREGAWQSAEKAYLGAEAESQYLSPGFVSLYHGQATALCRIRSKDDCGKSLQRYARKWKDTPLIPWIFESGFASTLQAASTQK